MAMFASAAQGALSWLILNAPKTVATELKAALVTELDSQHITLDGEVAGLKVAITCADIDLKGAYLELGGKLTEGFKFDLLECEVYKTAPLTEKYKCTVKSAGAATGLIESGELKGELVLHTFAIHEPGHVELKEVLLKIEPKTGPTGNFKTLRFEGSECPLPEVNQLRGTLFLQDCEKSMTKHQLRHLLVPGPLTALYIGGHSAKQLEVTKMLGSFWVKLGNDGAGINHTGLDWAAMDA